MKQWLVAFIGIHVLFYLAIGLDLPIFRQVFVFIYLTFVPGFILLKFLKLEEVQIVDTICFSIGLSLAFSMFVGFFINWSFLALGVSRPLSIIPLEVILSLLTLCLFFVGYRRDLFGDFGLKVNNLP